MADDEERRWWYLVEGMSEPKGPAVPAELGSARLVWREGMDAWLPPAQVAEVAAALSAAGAAQPRPVAKAPTLTRWYYQKADSSLEGPLGVGELQAAMLEGAVDGMTSVWREGMPAWLELREVPALRSMFTAVQQMLDAGGMEEDASVRAAPPSSMADVPIQSTPAAAPEPASSAAGAPAAAADDARKRKRAAKKKFQAKSPNSVYVSGLPACVSSEETLLRLFEPCGLLKTDPASGAKKAKLYLHADGSPKGDAVLTFARKESVELALSLRDGYVVPDAPTSAPIRVQLARFEAKGAYAPSQRSKDEDEARKKARILERRRLAEWEDGLDGAGHGVRVLILKHVWAPADVAALSADDEAAFYANLRADMAAECGKSGAVEKVTVFAGNEEGVVAVKFRTAEVAEVCQALMHGRRFGSSKLSAEFFDGQTNYKRDAPAGGAGGAGGGGGGGDESDGEEEGLDSIAEQQRRLEMMAAQLDAQSSDSEDE